GSQQDGEQDRRAPARSRVCLKRALRLGSW
ncbi:MAG: hypothetical protein QOF98_1390, partial [Streptomyces sp.]|nr:hypothetical protein [Streptomyces sp.]